MRYFYVYIIECSDKSYYIGVTHNLEKRISEHESGLISGYTSTRLPIKLSASFIFNDIRHAINFEKQIKGWSRKKKEALIKGDWDLVSKYAECSNLTHYSLRDLSSFDSAQDDK